MDLNTPSTLDPFIPTQTLNTSLGKAIEQAAVFLGATKDEIVQAWQTKALNTQKSNPGNNPFFFNPGKFVTLLFDPKHPQGPACRFSYYGPVRDAVEIRRDSVQVTSKDREEKHSVFRISMRAISSQNGAKDRHANDDSLHRLDKEKRRVHLFKR